MENIFHIHKYKLVYPSVRKCKCGKTQNRVCYPFKSSLIFWENERL